MGFASPIARPGTDDVAGLSQPSPELAPSLEPAAMRLLRIGRPPGTFPPGTARLDFPKNRRGNPPTFDLATTHTRAVPYLNGARKLTDQGAP